jgi:hypothetical protein
MRTAALWARTAIIGGVVGTVGWLAATPAALGDG